MDKFGTWFEGEKAAGLTDIKISVRHRPGISRKAIENEILAAEQAVTLGNVIELPTAKSFIPKHVLKMIESVTV